MGFITAVGRVIKIIRSLQLIIKMSSQLTKYGRVNGLVARKNWGQSYYVILSLPKLSLDTLLH